MNPASLEIPENVLVASINFVQVCCQHVAFLAGQGDINEELDLIETGITQLHL